MGVVTKAAGVVCVIVGALLIVPPHILGFAFVVADTTPPQFGTSITFTYGSFDNPVEPYSTTLSESSASPGLLLPNRVGDIVVPVYEDNPQEAKVSIDGVVYTMTLHSSSGNLRRYV